MESKYSHPMARAHHWSWSRISLAIAARILLVTCIFTAIAFALGLFVGIVVLGITAATNGQVDLARIYSRFGLPAAFLGMFAGLVGMLITEIRQLRRPRIRPALR
jgi:hypothetical protein